MTQCHFLEDIFFTLQHGLLFYRKIEVKALEQSSYSSSQLVKKFLNFMETEVSLPVRKTAASPNPEQDESCASLLSEFFNMHFNVTPPSTPRYMKLPTIVPSCFPYKLYGYLFTDMWQTSFHFLLSWFDHSNNTGKECESWNFTLCNSLHLAVTSFPFGQTIFFIVLSRAALICLCMYRAFYIVYYLEQPMQNIYINNDFLYLKHSYIF
jgi:hypothetical protein